MVLGLLNVVAGQDHLTMVSTILTQCMAVVTEQGGVVDLMHEDGLEWQLTQHRAGKFQS